MYRDVCGFDSLPETTMFTALKKMIDQAEIEPAP